MNLITDNEIDLTPAVRHARANKELMLRYNYDQSERSTKNRKLRTQKNIKNNKINFLNNK